MRGILSKADGVAKPAIARKEIEESAFGMVCEKSYFSIDNRKSKIKNFKT